MIQLFTDFGLEGPYVGQVKTVLASHCPDHPLIDLMHDAPRWRPVEAGLLLASLIAWTPPRSGVLCVVDPGVGSDRRALLLEADGRVLVGPDNGLLVEVARQADDLRCFEILWRPDRLSRSFHGRDLFAPSLATWMVGKPPWCRAVGSDSLIGWSLPAKRERIIYIDAFGNAMTALRASSLGADARLSVGNRQVAPAKTFAEVQEGSVFWYANSLGLVEIAVNRGSAAALLGLEIGSGVALC